MNLFQGFLSTNQLLQVGLRFNCGAQYSRYGPKSDLTCYARLEFREESPLLGRSRV